MNATASIPAWIEQAINDGRLTSEQWEAITEANRKEALPDGAEPRPTRVRLDAGFDSIVVEITEDDSGWEVSGIGYYRTSHGPLVQGTVFRHFPKEQDARRYADGLIDSHLGKGMKINELQHDVG